MSMDSLVSEGGRDVEHPQLNELGFYVLAGAPKSPAELLDEVPAGESLGLGSAFISERFNIKEAVTLSGAVVYMKDTDVDGRSDVKENWFEGLAELNSQLRANHPRLAIDNWIYVANGLRSTKVVNRKLQEQEPINISGMDFRFDPLTGKAEAVSGNGQF